MTVVLRDTHRVVVDFQRSGTEDLPYLGRMHMKIASSEPDSARLGAWSAKKESRESLLLQCATMFNKLSKTDSPAQGHN